MMRMITMNVDKYGFPIFDEDYDNPEIHVPEDIKEFYSDNQIKQIKEWCGEPTDILSEKIDHPKKEKMKTLF